MSFNPYVPCNCRKEHKIVWPSFRDKLEIREGLIDVKGEYSHDVDLINKFDSWKFCEHDQIAIEISMAQSITGWRELVVEKYPNQFPNFLNFIPIYNDSNTHNYDKQKTIDEINTLMALVEKNYHGRLNQFIQLLQKAIALDQQIYW